MLLLLYPLSHELGSSRLFALDDAKGKLMARIFVTCPETNMPVYTGLAMDKSSFESSTLRDKRVTCPHCGKVHVWQKEEAYLVGGEVGSK
jgi:hypothetical protein